MVYHKVQQEPDSRKLWKMKGHLVRHEPVIAICGDCGCKSYIVSVYSYLLPKKLQYSHLSYSQTYSVTCILRVIRL